MVRVWHGVQASSLWEQVQEVFCLSLNSSEIELEESFRTQFFPFCRSDFRICNFLLTSFLHHVLVSLNHLSCTKGKNSCWNNPFLPPSHLIPVYLSVVQKGQFWWFFFKLLSQQKKGPEQNLVFALVWSQLEDLPRTNRIIDLHTLQTVLVWQEESEAKAVI